MKKTTEILDSTMFFDCPDQTTVEVTAQAADGEIKTFYVQTAEGEYRSDLGCWITTDGSNGDISYSDFPEFDFDVIIKEAEEYMHALRDETYTGFSDEYGQNIYIIQEAGMYKVVTLNHDFINSDTNSYQHRFNEEINEFCSKEDALDFVKENY